MTAVVADHVHAWHPFGAGQGCASCEAWEFWPDGRVEMIDALPTGLLQQPPRPIYAAPVADSDLQIEVMSDLLEIARPDVHFGELEALAQRIIERVGLLP